MELANYLAGRFSHKEREAVERHLSLCDECLMDLVSAHEALTDPRAKKEKKGRHMKKPNIYLILTIIAFCLSFTLPRYFIQLLVATLILGIKWIADSKSTRMLVMIYEAWKRGGEKEASRILETIESGSKKRF